MKFFKRIPLFFVSAAIAVVLNTPYLYAFEDNFGPAEKLVGEHFDVYYSSGINIQDLSDSFDLQALDVLMTQKGGISGKPSAATTGLHNKIDILFKRVCDILDMPLYNFHGVIKICKYPDQLKAIYKTFFNQELKRDAFYFYEQNTIYICLRGFTKEILGHEMAHAVISNFFIVLPSVKVQEVLSMYVEFQIQGAIENDRQLHGSREK